MKLLRLLAAAGVTIALCLMGITTCVNAQVRAYAQAVTDSMLLSNAGPSWLHTNGNLAGHRYSVLTQLNPSNGDKLNVAWIFSSGGETELRSTPLQHDGLLYFAQDNKVFAIDARSGVRMWKYQHELPETFGGYNVDLITGKHLGLAILGNHIYFLSNDAKLHAIHYKTGEQIFVRQYQQYPQAFGRYEAEGRTGHTATVGPTAIPGQIVVPVSGTDFSGPSGWVYGVNPEDGEVLWECNMIPDPGAPDYEFWPEEGPERANGPWSTGSWDAELEMYYTTVGTGDSWNPSARAYPTLNNLDTASVVACSTLTGEAAWRSAMASDDQSDFNIMQTPMVIEVGRRKSLVYTDRNGRIHYLDAATGRLPAAP